ncbi:MAG: hypothetical protein A3F67_10700 [Verrucomicrobia bacterium RIFCSPHIGHO2_12_FULL_41_10]|nr:MAG: hypothetical protein A3F67_10700 [Verrucomicrobia bacterium RIFCSPHIGHO2_12_FULL_41_10]HLB33237.1 hypothetical protein [Chthoniobacterales bacterium]
MKILSESSISLQALLLPLCIILLFSSAPVLFAEKPLTSTSDTTLLKLSTNPLLCMFPIKEEETLEEISKSILPSQKNASSRINVTSLHQHPNNIPCATAKQSSYAAGLISKQFDLSSGLNELDEEATIPPLEEFRRYSANSKYQGTHATTIGATVIPVSQTWHGCAFHLIFGKSHDQTALQFRESLCADFGTHIAHYVFPPALQERASIKHFSVLIQQGIAGVVQNVVPILNPYLKNIKINIRLPEEHIPTQADFADSEDLSLPANRSLHPSPSSSSKIPTPSLLSSIPPSSPSRQSEATSFLPSILPAQGVIASMIEGVVKNVVKTTPREVNKALEKGINISTSISETIIPPIGGVSHELIREVLEKADAFVIQHLEYGINAGLAINKLDTLLDMYNTALEFEKKSIDQALLKYSVNPSVEYAKRLTDNQSSSDRARSSELQLLSSTSHLPSPTAAAVSTAYSLQPATSIRPVGRIVTARQNSLRLSQHRERLYPSSTGSKQQISFHPVNALLIKADSEEITKPLSDALLLTYKLNKITNLFAQPCETVSSPASPAVMTTPPIASAEKIFVQKIEQYNLQAIAITTRVTETTLGAVETMYQMSDLITQTIVPSATLIPAPLPENLEKSLEPLVQQLKASLKTIEDSVTEVALLKQNFLTSEQIYLEAMQERVQRVVNPQTATSMAAKVGRTSINVVVDSINQGTDAIGLKASLTRLSSQSTMKKNALQIAQERDAKIQTIFNSSDLYPTDHEESELEKEEADTPTNDSKGQNKNTLTYRPYFESTSQNNNQDLESESDRESTSELWKQVDSEDEGS